MRDPTDTSRSERGIAMDSHSSRCRCLLVDVVSGHATAMDLWHVRKGANNALISLISLSFWYCGSKRFLFGLKLKHAPSQLRMVSSLGCPHRCMRYGSRSEHHQQGAVSRTERGTRLRSGLTLTTGFGSPHRGQWQGWSDAGGWRVTSLPGRCTTNQAKTPGTVA